MISIISVKPIIVEPIAASVMMTFVVNIIISEPKNRAVALVSWPMLIFRV